MTPLQKRRHSTRRQGIRRSTIKLTLPTLVICTNCKQPTRPHSACSFCGFYGGKNVRSKK